MTNHTKRKEILTTCPFCGVGCNFYLQVEGERIIGVAPSRNHPVSQGRFCVKGWDAFDFIYHPDRLKRPSIRKSNKLKEVSWEEAEDFIAKNLKTIKRNFGPEKIGVISSTRCTNEENFLIQKFARAVLGTNNVDHCATTSYAPLVMGLKQSFGSCVATNSIDELINSKCIFIIGQDPLKTHPVIGWRILSAKERGAKLIVVDSYFSDLARFADIHLMIPPQTEVILINTLINVILENRLEDKQFLNERTENLEELKQIICRYTPFYAQATINIHKADVIKTAELYAKNKPASIIYPVGIADEKSSLDTVMSLANLSMLTGNIGLVGTGINPLRRGANAQGASDMGVMPDLFPGYQDVEDEHIRQRFQDHWKVKLPVKKGLGISEMFETPGAIKAFYILGEDFAFFRRNSKQVVKCLQKAEFVVVQDIFMDAAREFADAVLPVSTFAEKDGTFTNVERRVQLLHKVIEPMYHSKPDGLVIMELSKRLGSKIMDYPDSAAIMDEVSQLVPIYGGISHGRLEKQGLQWPCWNKTHMGTEFLHKGRFARGRGRFIGVEYILRRDKTNKTYPFILSSEGFPSALNRQSSEDFIEINKDDAKHIGLENGCVVEAITRKGSFSIKAYISDRVRKGVIWVSKPEFLSSIGGEYVCAAKIKIKK